MGKSVVYTAIKIYIILCVTYWIGLTLLKIEADLYYDVFGVALLILPLLGVYIGLKMKDEWGGRKSSVGRSIFLISMGVTMWTLGQTTYLGYYFLTRDVPFPGVPDYFFIFMDPLYALGLLAIMNFSGAKSNIKKSYGHLLLLFVPIAAIYINYKFFFGDGSIFREIDSAVIFDLIYTFGSTLLMAIAILALSLSLGKLGGKMKTAIYLILIGVALQYSGDVAYAIVEEESLRYNGNFADFLFFLSISSIILGMMSFSTDVFFKKVKETNEP